MSPGKPEAKPSSDPGPSLAAEQRRFRATAFHKRGGLGRVSRGWDEELDREVAIKEILPRHSGSERQRDRFEREAKITAGLEHPGIIPVYGRGEYKDGAPYYAMRFVDGDTLKEAILALHSPNQANQTDSRSDSSVSNLSGYTFVGLLTRFRDVCQTIAYAHAKETLHRDIKPDNILLGPYGETLVADWGLATKTGTQDRQNQTSGVTESDQISERDPFDEVTKDDRPGNKQRQNDNGMAASRHNESLFYSEGEATVGTPAYMSPEQIRGESPTKASDIYALGATLYSVLCGRPAFDHIAPDGLSTKQYGHRIDQLKSDITAGRFVRPRKRGHSSLTRSTVDSQLEAICLKAMAKERAARYDSAKEIAEDIDRWLNGQPVLCRTEWWSEWLARTIRKHLLAVIACASLVFLTVGLLTAVSWYQSSKAKNRTLERLVNSTAEVAVNGLEQPTADLRRSILELTFRQMSLAMREPSGTHSPQERARNALLVAQISKELADDKVEAITKHQDVIAYLEDLASKYPLASIAIRSSIAELHHRIAVMEHQLGDQASSEASFAIAERIQLELQADADDSKSNSALARVYGYRGDLRVDVGDFAGSVSDYSTSLRLRRQANIESDPIAALQFARAISNFARLERTAGRHQHAILFFQESYQQLLSAQRLLNRKRNDDGLLANDLRSPDFENDRANNLVSRAEEHMMLQDWESAGSLLQEALDRFTTISRDYPYVERYRRGAIEAELLLSRLCVKRENPNRDKALVHFTRADRTLREQPLSATHDDKPVVQLLAMHAFVRHLVMPEDNPKISTSDLDRFVERLPFNYELLQLRKSIASLQGQPTDQYDKALADAARSASVALEASPTISFSMSADAKRKDHG